MSGAAEDCEDGKAVFFYIALKKNGGENCPYGFQIMHTEEINAHK